ncbi:MAG: hypothetical protein EZS28_006659 [Streblomastix strix]|uniref:Uncharacterized protein n=1 Tax=Streblomastix strix TaxID=222440 RepID=A0A5J4WTC0_9EUKA|nr:MAG: hypothetical protein EZS28_006659 [Streblomastix strix]
MRAGTEISDSAFRLDLEFSDNETIYAERSKINEFGSAQEGSKDYYGHSHDSSHISGSDNWNFKFSQSTVQGGFPLSDALIFSTNMSDERTWIVLDYEIADSSNARDILVEKIRYMKKEPFFDIGHCSRDSSYGCRPQGWGATLELRTGEVLVAWDLLKREELRTIGKECNSDKIGQLFDNSARFWSDQLHNIFSEQIAQLGRLQHKSTTCANPIPLVQPRSNSGFIRKLIQYDPTQLCINRPEGLDCTMDKSIQPNMEELNHLDPPASPYDIIYSMTLKRQQTTAVVVVPWWPCQPWFTILLQENQRWIILGRLNQILILDPSLIAKRLHFPPGKLAAFLMVMQQINDTTI